MIPIFFSTWLQTTIYSQSRDSNQFCVLVHNNLLKRSDSKQQIFHVQMIQLVLWTR